MRRSALLVASVVTTCLGVGIGAGSVIAQAVERNGAPTYFGAPVSFQLESPSFPDGDGEIINWPLIQFVDWDADGDTDMLFVWGGHRLYLCDNDGAGRFTEEASVNLLLSIPGLDVLEVLGFRPVDLDADGVFELAALLSVRTPPDGPARQRLYVIPNALAPWQPSPSRLADVNADGTVNAEDIALVLGAWGPVKPLPGDQ